MADMHEQPRPQEPASWDLQGQPSAKEPVGASASAKCREAASQIWRRRVEKLWHDMPLTYERLSRRIDAALNACWKELQKPASDSVDDVSDGMEAWQNWKSAVAQEAFGLATENSKASKRHCGDLVQKEMKRLTDQVAKAKYEPPNGSMADFRQALERASGRLEKGLQGDSDAVQAAQKKWSSFCKKQTAEAARRARKLQPPHHRQAQAGGGGGGGGGARTSGGAEAAIRRGGEAKAGRVHDWRKAFRHVWLRGVHVPWDLKIESGCDLHAGVQAVFGRNARPRRILVTRQAQSASLFREEALIL